MSYLLCMEVWHEGKHVSFAQYPLPPGVVSSLVPHLIMVAAVCIEHLGHVIWGAGHTTRGHVIWGWGIHEVM